MPPRIFISCARAPTKLASPFRTAGSEVAMALCDTWSLQHLMRFRRRSATSVVDASENFYILRSCAQKTRITLPDRWQRRRNGFTRHVELPASNAFLRRYSATRVVDADENFYRLRSCAHKLASPFRTAGSEVAMALRDTLSLPAPNAFSPPLSNKRGCLREFLYPALVRPQDSHHPS